VIAEHPASAVNQHTDSNEMSADESGAAPLTLDSVVANLQLLLAVRRHARSQASAYWRSRPDTM
jgi:hypothetical protein